MLDHKIRGCHLALARAHRDTLANQLQVALNRVKESEALTGLLRQEAEVARLRVQEAGENIDCLQELHRRQGHVTISQPAPVGSMPPPPPPAPFPQATSLPIQSLKPALVPGDEIGPNDSSSQVGEDGSSTSDEDENGEGEGENENDDGLSYVSTAHSPIADPALKQLNEEKLPEPQRGSGEEQYLSG